MFLPPTVTVHICSFLNDYSSRVSCQCALHFYAEIFPFSFEHSWYRCGEISHIPQAKMFSMTTLISTPKLMLVTLVSYSLQDLTLKIEVSSFPVLVCYVPFYIHIDRPLMAI